MRFRNSAPVYAASPAPVEAPAKWRSRILRGSLLTMLLVLPVAATPAAEGKWRERSGCKLVADRFVDGDSFVLEWKDEDGRKTTRTYRLYGVDCPESDGGDKALTSRIGAQMAALRVDRETLLNAGKEAARFTERALKRGNVRIFTRGTLGQEVPKQPGRPQRRYALVEVLDENRQPRWLHELLLERGFARSFGEPAAWPAADEDRHGEEAAKRKFREDLDRIERRAKAAKSGVWAAQSKRRP